MDRSIARNLCWYLLHRDCFTMACSYSIPSTWGLDYISIIYWLRAGKLRGFGGLDGTVHWRVCPYKLSLPFTLAAKTLDYTLV